MVKTSETKKVASKSFLSVGPTLHYSHNNVLTCWWLSLVLYALVCFFWSKIVTGSFISFRLESLFAPELWRLGEYVTTGVSIFEYPWQILVLGMLMGTIAVVPVLVSQLLSFKYSLFFLPIMIFIGNLPGFSGFTLISCLAVASRPLRFRSRFISVALCTSPQLIYWAIFGWAEVIEPVKWGFAFIPWISAWLFGLALAGVVLGIGHYTRYKPGLIWSGTLGFLILAIFVFEYRIGFAELDYQLYVAKYDPEEVAEFYDHRITEALDKTITNESVINYLAGFFYPTEPIPLRQRLKDELQSSLANGHWPLWFIVPEEMKYQEKRKELTGKYDLYIKKRPKSPKMPIALYYKAMLSEFSPDIKLLKQKEILSFYSDYPFERSRTIWYELYSDYGKSRESIEARWRIAMDWASQGQFNEAMRLLNEARMMIRSEMIKIQENEGENDVSKLFRSPADTAIDKFKLEELRNKVEQLRMLVSEENRTGNWEMDKYLAEFIDLNPHSVDYAAKLDELSERMKEDNPIYDNVQLARAKLLEDDHLKAETLSKLHSKYKDTDAGIRAYYELAQVKKKIWQQQVNTDMENKKEYLRQARDMLEKFMSSYPESIYSEQAHKILSNLPMVEQE